MNEKTVALTEGMQEMMPNLCRVGWPRRIVPPNGFANPKYYGQCSLTGGMLVWNQPETRMFTHAIVCLNALLLMYQKVPTYFVQEEFAEAVANTRLPANFQLSDLKWPLDAILFVLPHNFVRKYLGYTVPFLSVARCRPAVYPEGKHVSWAIKEGLEIRSLPPINNSTDRMLVHATLYPKDEVPIDYTGSWPLDKDLASLDDAPMEDTTSMEAALLGMKYTRAEDSPKTEKEDGELEVKISKLGIKLLLAFAARPHLVKHSVLTRPEKIKRGRVRDALWSPNIIGYGYNIRYIGKGPGTGTHASPRMFIQPGHFTHQFVGKRGNPDFVSVNELPRRPDGLIDWPRIDGKVQEAFWRNHEVRWIDPVLVDKAEGETSTAQKI